MMLQLIKSRRSIRKFSGQPVEDELLEQIIEAGTWAPSGLNNQPWKVAIVRDAATRKAIAPLTRYSSIIEGAPVLLAPFLDTAASYDRTKDVQAMGAFIQNMLLAVHALGLGGVWLGEILKNKEKVAQIIKAPETFELMAVIALGHPAEKGGKGSRKGIKDVIFYRG